MKTELRKRSHEDGQAVYELLQSIPKEENGFTNLAHGMTYEEFKEWLKLMEDYEHGRNMPDWMVPSTEYWFLVDDQMVGTIRIRHYLTDALRTYGGHIGYAIAPAYRGKGYAKLMLSKACEKAKEFGIKELLIDPHCDNIASRRVVESCGGILAKENDHTVSYWISI